MNVVKVIRPGRDVVKLIKATTATVQLIRPSTTPARLVNTKGVVNYGGAGDAAQITMSTDIGTYYRLQKQL